MSLFIMMLGCIAFIPTLLAILEWRAWWALQQDSQEVVATLQYHWETHLGLSRFYFLICEAEVVDSNGDYHLLQFSGEVEREVYLAAIEVGPLLYYSARHPQRFRLAGQPFEHLRWTFSTVLAWGLVGFFIWIALG